MVLGVVGVSARAHDSGEQTVITPATSPSSRNRRRVQDRWFSFIWPSEICRVTPGITRLRSIPLANMRTRTRRGRYYRRGGVSTVKVSVGCVPSLCFRFGCEDTLRNRPPPPAEYAQLPRLPVALPSIVCEVIILMQAQIQATPRIRGRRAKRASRVA